MRPPGTRCETQAQTGSRVSIAAWTSAQASRRKEEGPCRSRSGTSSGSPASTKPPTSGEEPELSEDEQRVLEDSSSTSADGRSSCRCASGSDNKATSGSEEGGGPLLPLPLNVRDRFGSSTSQDRSSTARWSGSAARWSRALPEETRRIGAASRPSGDRFEAPASVLRPLLEEATDRWQIDVLALAELSGNRPLSTLAVHLFAAQGLTEQFGMDATRMAAFFQQIEEGYPDNPYHNRSHAASVLHLMHMVLSRGGVAAACAAAAGGVEDEARRLGLVRVAGLLAAAVHDFEHEGRNNDFLVKTASPKALRYNGSVNENHHAEAAFEVLEQPECNFLADLPTDEFRTLRNLVVNMVLATDAAQSKKYVDAFRECLAAQELLPAVDDRRAPRVAWSAARSETCADGVASAAGGHAASRGSPAAFEPKTPEDAVLALQIALKCADVGHLSLPWSAHLQWVLRLESEFFEQGDHELSLGMEAVSSLMDRSKPGVSHSQGPFFDFITPLFQVLFNAFPGVKPMHDAVLANGDRWRTLEAARAA